MSIGEQTGQTRSKLLTRQSKSNGEGEWELEREMVAKLGSKLGREGVSFPPGRRRGSSSKGEWDRNGECCSNTLE